MSVSAYAKLLLDLQKWNFYPSAALVYIDVRHMRTLNRFASPQYGDSVIDNVAKVLAQWAQPSGLATRLWSNEFVAVKAIDHPQSAADEAERLRGMLTAIHYPSRIGNNHLAVAIGLVVVAQDNPWVPALEDAADACAISKTRGINQIFSSRGRSTDNNADAVRAHLVVNFRRLLTEDRLVLHPQPIMDIRSAKPRLAKAEFLIRQKQDGQFVTLPQETIATLEHYGLSSELDRFSSRFVLNWVQNNPQALQKLDNISLNLSAKSISDGNFMYALYREVRNANLAAGKLCFEITETAAIDHLSAARDAIADFKAIGCRFSLDDFGSGLCSFGYLQTLAVDEVKIDGRFIHDLIENKVSQQIVRAIHQVARATGKLTVAEFVNTPEKLAMIRDIGVDYAQGALFSMATDPQDLLDRL
ncbi:MAG TPA: bifunctional diguanylate cyclase/phosphodiesterase [Stenotrophobium sp.]|nr:bifunctional diguanylate cyclase/phosphodiesterase [Stenotrophobium sp.]